MEARERGNNSKKWEGAQRWMMGIEVNTFLAPWQRNTQPHRNPHITKSSVGDLITSSFLDCSIGAVWDGVLTLNSILVLKVVTMSGYYFVTSYSGPSSSNSQISQVWQLRSKWKAGLVTTVSWVQLGHSGQSCLQKPADWLPGQPQMALPTVPWWIQHLSVNPKESLSRMGNPGLWAEPRWSPRLC